MRITWGHLAGFLVVSTAIFALGILRGQQRATQSARQAYLDRPVNYDPVRPKGLNKHELAFVDRVPAYPHRMGPEIPTGTHRDAFGLPTRSKKFDTQSKPDEVIAWYERHFRLKSYNVYTVKNDLLSGLGALDLLRKQMYYITAIKQGEKRTMVIAAWSDGTKKSDKSTHLVPLDVGGKAPVMLSGDGKSHEMAVYMVDDMPKRAYSRFGGQLSGSGWKELEAPSTGQAAKLREHQRSYVNGDRELMLSARRQNGKTVVICMVSPRVG